MSTIHVKEQKFTMFDSASVSLFHWITKSLIFGNLAIFSTVTDEEIVDLSAGSLYRRESQL